MGKNNMSTKVAGVHIRMILLIIICMSIIISGCGLDPSAEKQFVYAKERFMADNYEKYIQNLREKSGLNDLEIELEIDEGYYNYDRKKNAFYVYGSLKFISDDIDDYYTTEYNKQTSKKLAEVLNNLKSIYYEDTRYSYSNSDLKIFLEITNNGEHEIHVKTSSGRDYKLSYYDDCDRVEIDGEWVYYQDKETEASSSNISDSTSYTGMYDATLKYSGTEGVLICISEDAMERFMTAVNNGNEGTLQELFLDGQCAYTEQGTKCNIVDKKLTKCQVKLLDGSYAGNTVWVVIEALQEK